MLITVVRLGFQGNMNEASSSTTFPQELADIIDGDKVNNFLLRFEPEDYNYYQQQQQQQQQLDHRDIGVPLQCPLMIDYQSAGVNSNHSPVLQQKPFPPMMKVSDWRCQQSDQLVTENPKKRLNNVCGQNVVNKKVAHADRMQEIGCLRERVPVRRSQKLADRITVLQKLVSPYGKTDTASVLEEAHISINLLHDQIKDHTRRPVSNIFTALLPVSDQPTLKLESTRKFVASSIFVVPKSSITFAYEIFHPICSKSYSVRYAPLPPFLLLPCFCSWCLLRRVKPDVVVNCAALSVPRACETDPALAMSVNVPSTLVTWLSSFTQTNTTTLLIHLSTDQVYQGTKSFYKEDDQTLPVNVYGKSKVAAEEYISHNCSNFIILRSIIFGPQTISPVSKSLPIQWIDGVLAKGQEAEFFHDEFRCPVYVKDVVNIIQILIDRWISDGNKSQLVLNAGGPNRLSRAEMAEIVARVRGYNTTLIKPVSASSVDRGVKSPADISMDISKLIQTLDFTPTSFEDGVKLTFHTNK